MLVGGTSDQRHIGDVHPERPPMARRSARSLRPRPIDDQESATSQYPPAVVWTAASALPVPVPCGPSSVRPSSTPPPSPNRRRTRSSCVDQQSSPRHAATRPATRRHSSSPVCHPSGTLLLAHLLCGFETPIARVHVVTAGILGGDNHLSAGADRHARMSFNHQPTRDLHPRIPSSTSRPRPALHRSICPRQEGVG